MSLYGSELSNYNSKYMQEIYVAWRKTMRKLLNLHYRTHNYIVCGITECISLKLHRRVELRIGGIFLPRNRPTLGPQVQSQSP